jgi:hypothetical protein
MWQGIIMQKKCFTGVQICQFCNQQSHKTNHSFCTLTRESKWLKRINFIVTHFTSYYDARPTNSTNIECEEHFYPKDSKSATEVGSQLNALQLFNLGGLLCVCAVMILVSIILLIFENIFFKFHNATKIRTQITELSSDRFLVNLDDISRK